MSFQNYGLGLLVVYAADMDKSARFYEALGLNLERHAHPPCGEHFSTIDSECVFEIYQQRDDWHQGSRQTFGFYVSSVDIAIKAIGDFGGEIKSSPKNYDFGRMATAIDPDGNKVLLMAKNASE